LREGGSQGGRERERGDAGEALGEEEGEDWLLDLPKEFLVVCKLDDERDLKSLLRTSEIQVCRLGAGKQCEEF
jgi:hypothetical protein